MENLNLVEDVKKILAEHEIILNKHVPFKVLQCNYNERQDVYGLERKFSVYCVSNNNSISITSKMRNNFFEISNIYLEISKTIPQTSTVIQNSFDLLEGNNLTIKTSFNELKKAFYDLHINETVLPQK